MFKPKEKKPPKPKLPARGGLAAEALAANAASKTKLGKYIHPVKKTLSTSDYYGG